MNNVKNIVNNLLKTRRVKKTLKKEIREELGEDILPVMVAGITAYESGLKAFKGAVKRNIYKRRGDEISLWRIGSRVGQISRGKRAGR